MMAFKADSDVNFYCFGYLNKNGEQHTTKRPRRTATDKHESFCCSNAR